MPVSADELNSTLVGLRDGYIELGRANFAHEVHLLIKLWVQGEIPPVKVDDCNSILQEILGLCRKEFEAAKRMAEKSLANGDKP